MRPIKFDLPLNGTRIATLEQLEENLTPEILEPFRSGKLAKWLRARSLDEQAEAVEALLAENVQDEVQLFIKLCEVFEREVDEDIASDMIEYYNNSLFASDEVSFENISESEKIESKKENQGFEDFTITEEQLELLNESQRVELAVQSNLSEEVQAKLSSTGTPAVREALASNPALTEQQQNYLVTTGSQQVKCQLAKNPSLIVAIQSQLVNDESWDVRQNLAGNPSLNIACQSQLIQDQNVDVRITLAGNSALTNEYQQRIAISEEENSRVLVSLAKNLSLSDTTMEKLANNNDREVKESLASHSSLPEFLQARLIANNSGNVREILAGNPSLKIAQQAELAHVGDVDVRLALLDNPSLDESVKARIIMSFDEYDLNRMGRRFEYEMEREERLWSELQKAMDKYYSSLTGFFSTIEKRERLNKECERVSDLHREASNRRIILAEKVYRLKDILSSQTGL